MSFLAIPFFSENKSSGIPWYNNSWNYRTKITVDKTKVDATLTSFPVYLDLQLMPADFHTYVSATAAQDIRVTESDGITEVPREVVYYNSSTDKGELWFKAGTVSSSIDTDFYIYFGNTSATEPADNATYGKYNTWTTYNAVYHLNNSGDQLDSTTNGYTLTNGASVTATSSAIISGTAQDHGTTGTGKGFKVNNSMGITASNQSFGGWFRWNSFSSPTVQMVLTKTWDNNTPNANTQWNYRIYCPSSTQISIQTFGSGQAFTTTHGFSTGVWQHIYATLDRATTVCSLYINGSLSGTFSTGFTTIANNGSNFTIGNQTTRPSSFQTGNEGRFISDEVRVTSQVLSLSHIKTEYNNQNSPSTFYSIGAVQSKP